jgi:hypothetical protein
MHVALVVYNKCTQSCIQAYILLFMPVLYFTFVTLKVLLAMKMILFKERNI